MTQKNEATTMYTLVSSSSSSSDAKYHVMRLQPPTDITALQPPLRLVRSSTWDLAAVFDSAPLPLAAATALADASSSSALAPKADMAKIAPFGGAATARKNLFKRKTKAYVLGERDEERSLDEGVERRPWVLTDFENLPSKTLVGKPEDDLNHYFILIPDRNSATNTNLRVIPAANLYKFSSQAPFKTLSADEANEIMEARGSLSEKVRMVSKRNKSHKKVLQGIDEEEEGEGGEVDAVALARRQKSFKAVYGENKGGEERGRRRTRDMDLEEEGMDYNYGELFQDDEEVHYGVDEDETKDIKRRIRRGVGLFEIEDEDEDQVGSSPSKPENVKTVKKERRFARKVQGAFADSDDENPYVSDVSDSDEDDDVDNEKNKDQPDAAVKSKAAAQDLFGETIYGKIDDAAVLTTGIAKAHDSVTSLLSKKSRRKSVIEGETSRERGGSSSSSDKDGKRQRSISPPLSKKHKTSRSISPDVAGRAGSRKRGLEDEDGNVAKKPKKSSASRTSSPTSSQRSSPPPLPLLTEVIALSILKSHTDPIPDLKKLTSLFHGYDLKSDGGKRVLKGVVTKFISKDKDGLFVLKSEFRK